MEKEKIKKQKGITLIALVVTIVVLLILAAVSIGMLTGENGIIKKAQESNEETEQAKVEELVTLAINSLIAQNLGFKDGITPDMVAAEVNKMQNRDDVTTDANTFPSDILFGDESIKVEINESLEIDSITEIEKAESYGGIYSVSGLEGKIAPNDLFDYEIINEAEASATELDSLPTKKARITRIKPEYCNNGGYNPETGEMDLTDTNYEIIYKGTTISDTLVLPYQVEIDGEMYKITEVNLYAEGCDLELFWTEVGPSFPNVETVIYPNTVERIHGKQISYAHYENNTTLKNIVLPSQLKNIDDGAFFNCSGLTSVEIPSSVTSIGDYAFYRCSSLTSIEIPSSVTSIGDYAFYWCSSVTSIEIPSSVTSIGYEAFSRCSGLTSIEIPSSVTTIEYGAFNQCTNLTTVNYTGTEEQWKQISGTNYIPSGATIIYNYTGE